MCLKSPKSSVWPELEEIKSKGLWHQLSLKMLDIAKHSKCVPEKAAKDLYSTFVQGMEKRMNQSMLVEISYYLSNHYRNPEEAVALLDHAEEKMSPPTQEAIALCKTLKAEIMFSRMNDMMESKRMLDEAEPLLDDAPISEKLHGRYYLLAYKWHKKEGNYSQMYINGLRYLGMVDIEHLPLQRQILISRDLAVAAMIAEDVYNIGELMCNPVCNSLKECEEFSWMYDLLQRMESGRFFGVQCYQKRCELQAPELCDNWPAVQRKSRLLSLLQIFTLRRHIKLKEIEKAMRLSATEVEHLLMTAMAKDLIRGEIDQTSGVVSISWVRPKLLSKSQLKSHEIRIDEQMQELQEVSVQISEPETEFPESRLPRVTKAAHREYHNYNF